MLPAPAAAPAATRDGGMEPKSRNLRIAIFNSEQAAYSQTFIRAHIERLPGTILPIYGGNYYWKYQGSELFRAPYRAINYFSQSLPSDLVRYARARMVQRLASFLVRERIDVVLAEFATNAFDLVEPCRAAKVPLVVHCHGFDVYVNDLLNTHKQDYRRLFRTAAEIVVVSHAMQRRVEALGAPPERIHVNWCGVDETLFVPTDAGANPAVLFAAGRFVEKKGPHLTILAFHEARKNFPEARLVMTGDGPLLDACKQLVRALRLADCVEFTGRQDHEGVAKRMSEARALAQHSVTAPDGDCEGSPVAIVEAGAAGLPVVATRHTGILDTVVEGETGFLTDEHDIEGMAKYMVTLFENPALASRMGRNAREHVAARFSMDRVIHRLHSILEKAAARQG
ncbi:MAG: glycosyltransferase [Bryobacteraceae bacterium]